MRIGQEVGFNWLVCRQRWTLFGVLAVALLVNACLAWKASRVEAGVRIEVDAAHILAVDVSDSVDATRYRLQMDGIAFSLEEPRVIASITSGPRGAILLSLVSWSDRAEVSIDWQLIRSEEDARRVAGLVRALPQKRGEYTCMSRMMAMVKESVAPNVPGRASRVVLDVSGDGIDNCRDKSESQRERDELVAMGVTINGLPIIVKGENDVVGSGAYRAPGIDLKGLLIGPGTQQTTLDQWYTDNVIGGPAGFLLKANGFEDFGRAFRQKFVTEISSRE